MYGKREGRGRPREERESENREGLGMGARGEGETGREIKDRETEGGGKRRPGSHSYDTAHLEGARRNVMGRLAGAQEVDHYPKLWTSSYCCSIKHCPSTRGHRLGWVSSALCRAQAKCPELLVGVSLAMI